ILALCGAHEVLAQTYTLTAQGRIDLGAIADAATGDSIFRIDPSSGAVTRISGEATRNGSAPAHAAVKITCVDGATPGACAASDVQMQVGPAATPTGRAKAIANLTVAMGTAIETVAPTGASIVSFSIGPVGPGLGKT